MQVPSFALISHCDAGRGHCGGNPVGEIVAVVDVTEKHDEAVVFDECMTIRPRRGDDDEAPAAVLEITSALGDFLPVQMG